MKKARRLNLRLTEAIYRQVERRAQTEGVSTTQYIRFVVETDLRTDSDAIVRRLARQILFVSVAIQHLLVTDGDREQLQAVAEEVRRLTDQLGLDDG